MKTITTLKEIREEIRSIKDHGFHIALVPTMGNMHQGHLDLVIKAKLHGPNTKVITSIFVNPLQFGENSTQGSDYDRYPRTLAEDQEKLASVGCDLIFAPKNEREIYRDYPNVSTKVDVGEIGRILEGASRPGFFDGMATVVLTFINICNADIVVFGEKDWQQVQIVRKFTTELGLDTEVIIVSTRREDNGLAMSSRNGYLTHDEKEKASKIYEVLKFVSVELIRGEKDFEKLEETGNQKLANFGFIPQYLAIRSPNLDPPISEANGGKQELIVLVAAFLGSTRLIDNVFVNY